MCIKVITKVCANLSSYLWCLWCYYKSNCLISKVGFIIFSIILLSNLICNVRSILRLYFFSTVFKNINHFFYFEYICKKQLFDTSNHQQSYFAWSVIHTFSKHMCRCIACILRLTFHNSLIIPMRFKLSFVWIPTKNN